MVLLAKIGMSQFQTICYVCQYFSNCPGEACETAHLAKDPSKDMTAHGRRPRAIHSRLHARGTMREQHTRARRMSPTMTSVAHPVKAPTTPHIRGSRSPAFPDTSSILTSKDMGSRAPASRQLRPLLADAHVIFLT